jgi:hypothetical protein
MDWCHLFSLSVCYQHTRLVTDQLMLFVDHFLVCNWHHLLATYQLIKLYDLSLASSAGQLMDGCCLFAILFVSCIVSWPPIHWCCLFAVVFVVSITQLSCDFMQTAFSTRPVCIQASKSSWIFLVSKCYMLCPPSFFLFPPISSLLPPPSSES